jgi:hypothetical protein
VAENLKLSPRGIQVAPPFLLDKPILRGDCLSPAWELRACPIDRMLSTFETVATDTLNAFGEVLS